MAKVRVSVYFLICFCTSGNLFGQVEQPHRFEFEINSYDDYFDIINGEEDGLLLIRQVNERNRQGDPLFEILKLDTTLSLVWEKKMYISRYLEYRGYDYFKDSFYLLFKNVKGNSKDLEIIGVDAAKGDTTHYTVINLVPIRLTEFEMTQDAALIGGYFNYNPFVIHYDLRTEKSKVLPGIYQSRSELIQLKVDDVSGTFVVVVTQKTFDKRNTISVKTYDFNGDLISNTLLEPDIDKGLVSGQAADFDLDINLMGGTYANKRSSYSRGLFVASVRNDGKQEIKYYNFGELENFFTYMKAKRRNRISKKIERKKINGKKVRFNYRFLIHDIIEEGDQYIMLGEAYYPKYSSSGYNSFVYGGQGIPTNYGMYFIGYRYTHAVVIGFDKKGNILWDNSFEIEDVITPDLDQYVHAESRNGSIVLLYLYDHEIRSKIIKGNEVVEGKSFDQIRLSFGDDVVKEDDSEVEKLKPWYDGNYFAYGEQKIKNMKDSGVKLNRRVFYVNKVKYK